MIALKPTIINDAWVSLPPEIVERASALRHLAETQERDAKRLLLFNIDEAERLFRQAIINRTDAQAMIDAALAHQHELEKAA